MANCKICQSEHCQEIDKMIKDGIVIDYLFGWCKDRGFKVSRNTLRNHAKSHIDGFNFTEKTTSIMPKNEELTPIEYPETIINFEEYCQSIGLDPVYFKNLENHLEHIIYGSQKALSLLFFKNTAIVDRKLTNNLIGNGSYPVAEIKGLRSLFEMYSRIIGLETMIDENTAIKTLENLGYNISKTIDINPND
jgi:hypothetical protein